MAPPPAETAANTPKARFRSGPSGKVVVIRASEVGEAIAPPTPWRARAASSCQGSWAKPPRREARVKSRIPAMNTRRHQDVAYPAAQQEQAAEGERVGAQYPGEVGGAEVEGGLDMRERDVHDRRVEDDHELACGDDGERHAGAPLPAGRARYPGFGELRACH